MAADALHQAVGQHGDRRTAGDAHRAVDRGDAGALKHLARHDQRYLAGIFEIGHIARQAGVDQGDIAGRQFHAVVALLQARTAVQLEYRVVVVEVVGRHFLAGPVEIHLGQVDHAELDGAALELPERTVEIRTEGARAEAPAGLVDPAEPCLESIASCDR
ncbi:hypothetical protein D9M70_561940 [compost metagenome]